MCRSSTAKVKKSSSPGVSMFPLVVEGMPITVAAVDTESPWSSGGVGVGESVGVGIWVGLGVGVGVGVGVAVGVGAGVAVRGTEIVLGVAVAVGGIGVGVAVGLGASHALTKRATRPIGKSKWKNRLSTRFHIRSRCSIKG